MPTIFETLISDHELLLELEPEELAGFILEYLNTLPERHGELNSHNFCLQIDNSKYPRQSHKDIKEALMEAWTWLEREGLIAPRPDAAEGKWVFVTRRGKTLQQASDLERYHKSNILPKQFLHPILAQKVWHLFVRGDYDTAIFQALKAVEVAVRKSAGFPVESIGTDLMRKSFHPENGPLVDPKLPKAEREAIGSLFAGAIGIYKNPQSHRDVSIDDPVTAAEIIILASHLLRIVDSCTASE